MPRPSEASAPARRPLPVLPLVLAAAAIVAALLALQPAAGGLFAVLALLLTGAACALAGAEWSRQVQTARLHDARQSQQLLLQLSDAWIWQTDADHRLVRLQPPQAAPASSWAEGAFSGQPLWERFEDGSGQMRSRLQAQAPLPELRVLQRAGTNGNDSGAASAGHVWLLRGQPRFDHRGVFTGYLGFAQPAESAEMAAAERQAFEAMLRDAPVPLCLLRRPPGGQTQLQRLNPAARRLLALGDGPAEGVPLARVLDALPERLRHALPALEPGQSAEHEGWIAWLVELGGGPGRQLLLAIVPGAPPSASAPDTTTASLAAEHASFSYTVSHDLRAPIRVVEGFARILKEDYGRALDRIGNDHLDRVLSAAARMNSMIDALLSLSQLSTQPLQRQPVNLSQLAQYVIEDLKRTAPEREVSLSIAPDLVTQGDPTLLRMALENLLGNAWKYSAKATHAEIAFERVDQAGQPAFCVRDNGAGFDMRFADRLFGVFQRLHSSGDFQGTGVGLASARRIIRRHGGEIWAESEVGQGARFYFTLKN
ncbi:hypothetical protein HLB44_25365 [Aquincola sp. S2]|uniref:histidine kinase n=1 Tax=Pseudaquabacterium terrae TaxID=2732868 RepID=A0ABX2ENZ1_9BURK|nr:ATP-binding protein [Aquabacterium terrae]NRF70343.1 hypothetical protein [Aquabacterium terrae]